MTTSCTLYAFRSLVVEVKLLQVQMLTMKSRMLELTCLKRAVRSSSHVASCFLASLLSVNVHVKVHSQVCSLATMLTRQQFVPSPLAGTS